MKRKTNSFPTFEALVDDAPPSLKMIVKSLKKVKQSYDWHPEGNVLVHTKIVFHRTSALENLDLMFAAFFHDLGKSETTKPNGKGGYSAHNHEKISVDLINYNDWWIKDWGINVEKVKWIVENHMRVKYIDDMKPKKRKELSNHIWFDELIEFKACDSREGLTILDVILAKGNPLLFLFNKLKALLKK